MAGDAAAARRRAEKLGLSAVLALSLRRGFHKPARLINRRDTTNTGGRFIARDKPMIATMERIR
jgi:hypothetical protein